MCTVIGTYIDLTTMNGKKNPKEGRRACASGEEGRWLNVVTGLLLSNENTIGPAEDLLALVLREASRDRR